MSRSPDESPGSFEEKLERIDTIVRELESGTVTLDRAIELFKEGKALAAQCEALLKSSQAQIDAAMGPSTGSD
ncbi:MAG TPA: exodeoxyribonuclease VII small subunit [Candidatus Baltobacteraceae bacterium]|nr:exodeoxyribonuclease VII small subunit [Candidatus Baltobacteraceae bacterium]